LLAGGSLAFFSENGDFAKQEQQHIAVGAARVGIVVWRVGAHHCDCSAAAIRQFAN